MESQHCRPQPGAALPGLDQEAAFLETPSRSLWVKEGRGNRGLLTLLTEKKRGCQSLKALCWPRSSERRAGVFTHRRVRTCCRACKMQIPGRLQKLRFTRSGAGPRNLHCNDSLYQGSPVSRILTKCLDTPWPRQAGIKSSLTYPR